MTAEKESENFLHNKQQYVLICNLDKGVTKHELSSFISKHSKVNDYTVNIIGNPAALISLNSVKECTTLIANLNHSAYKSEKLTCLGVNGNCRNVLIVSNENESDLASCDRKKLLVAGLSHDVTTENISDKIIAADESLSSSLINIDFKMNSKNGVFMKKAIVTFENEKSAECALKSLNSSMLNGKKLFVSYLNTSGIVATISPFGQLKKFNHSLFEEHNELRTTSNTALMCNLSAKTSVNELREQLRIKHLVMPLKVDIKCKPRCDYAIAFLTFANVVECNDAVEKMRGNKILGRDIYVSYVSVSKQNPMVLPSKKEDYSLMIFNLPYNTTTEAMKAEFPSASEVVMVIKNNKPNGTCVLYFKDTVSRDACKAIIPGMRIGGRPIRVDVKEVNSSTPTWVSQELPKATNRLRLFNLPFKALEKDILSEIPKSKLVTLILNQGKPSGDASVTFENSDDAKAFMASKKDVVISGRKIRFEWAISVKSNQNTKGPIITDSINKKETDKTGDSLKATTNEDKAELLREKRKERKLKQKQVVDVLDEENVNGEKEDVPSIGKRKRTFSNSSKTDGGDDNMIRNRKKRKGKNIT